MKRSANAIWEGSLKEGKGTFGVASGAIKGTPYSFKTRFEETPGANPEELIAAAHASCFAMAFSAGLGRAGTPPQKLQVSATVTFDKKDAGWGVTKSELEVIGTVPGVDAAGFQKAAEAAKDGCPISQALKNNVALSVMAKLA